MLIQCLFLSSSWIAPKCCTFSPCQFLLEQKGGSLSLNWVSLLHTQLYHFVCFTHCSVIWQHSWVQANLHLQYNGFCVFCNAEIYYMQLKQKSSNSLSAIILWKEQKTAKRKRSFTFLHSWFCFQSFLSPWQSPLLLTTSFLHTPGNNPEKGINTRDKRNAAFQLQKKMFLSIKMSSLFRRSSHLPY